MIKKLLYTIAFTLASSSCFSQIATLPASESFDTAFTEGTSVTFIPNWVGNTVAAPSSKIFRDVTDFNSAPAAMSIIPTSAFNGDIQVGLNLTNYQSVGITFLAKSMLNGAGTRDAVLNMATSIDGGTTWIGSVLVASLPNANQTSFTSFSYSLPVAANNQSNVLVRFLVTRSSTGSSTAAKMVIDDVTIQQVTTPQITINQNALTFTQVVGTPSQSQTFDVSGSNLTNNIILTAPNNYEISLNQNSSYNSSLTLTPVSGIVAVTPIYVRLNSATNGLFTGNLTVSSSIAITQNVALSGNCVTPTVTNPTPLSINEGSSYSVLTNWDNTNVAGTYPPNMVLWTHSTSDPDLNTLFIENWTCQYNLTSRSRFTGEGTNGIGIINTGNSQFTGVCDGTDPTQTTGTTVTNERAGAIVFALNTSNITAGSIININWTGRTILKNARVYGLKVQYRIGNGASDPNAGWQEFSPTQDYTSGEDNTFENKVTALPFSCNGQSLVQVRWVYNAISGTGARAQLALDDVSVDIATLSNTNFIADANNFYMIPNPSNKEIVTLSSQQEQINVYDAVGKLILNIKNASYINTRSFQSGIYFVKISSGLTKKLIIK